MTEFLLMLAALVAILLRATHRPAEARATEPGPVPRRRRR